MPAAAPQFTSFKRKHDVAPPLDDHNVTPRLASQNRDERKRRHRHHSRAGHRPSPKSEPPGDIFVSDLTGDPTLRYNSPTSQGQANNVIGIAHGTVQPGREHISTTPRFQRDDDDQPSFIKVPTGLASAGPIPDTSPSARGTEADQPLFIGLNEVFDSPGEQSPQNQSKHTETDRAESELTVFKGKSYSHEDLRKLHVDILQRTKSDKNDYEAWQDLIDFQIVWSSQIGERSRNSHRALISVRIALYEQALTSLSKENASRTTLARNMMRECQSAWDNDEMHKQWQILLTKIPDVDLQLEYLNFLQSDKVQFSFENCTTHYKSLLTRLREDMPASTTKLVYAVLRYASFARDAGYLELSRAIWQILFHANMHASNQSKAGRMQALRRFWESNEPRLGDDEALSDLHTTKNPWLQEEFRFQSRQPFDQEDDPYSVVLFDDLEPFVLLLDQIDDTLLLNGFLCFAQLPALPLSDNLFSWWADPFLRRLSGNGSLVSFSALSTLQILYSESMSWPNFSVGCGPRFMKNVLRHYADNSDAVAEYYMGFVTSVFPREAEADCRALVKLKPGHVRLYAAYALSRLAAGNGERALQIIDATLSGLKATDEIDRVFLMRARYWQEALSGNVDKAIERQPLSAYYAKRLGVIGCHVSVLGRYLEKYDIATAMEEYKDQVAGLGPIDAHLLAQEQAHLILVHISNRRPYSPRRLLTLLEAHMDYQHNSVIAAARNALVMKVVTAVKLDNFGTLERETSLVSLALEIEQGLSTNTNDHSKRLLLEDALTHTVAQRADLIWHTYVEFEYGRDRRRALATFHRGLSAMPWSKAFAVACLAHLAKQMSKAEIESIESLLRDRGLRL